MVEPTGAAPQSAVADHEEFFKIFSSRTNRAILGLLAVEPTYPRKIGNLLAVSEGEAARRLKQMEGLGLVSGTWSYVGKNIKLYKLAADHLTLEFRADGIHVRLGQGSSGRAPGFTLLPFHPNVPMADRFLGREKELAALKGKENVVVVEGMPGIGKTALVAQHIQNHGNGRAVFWHSFRGLESLHWLANRLAVFLAQQGEPALLHAVEQGLDIADNRELMLRSVDSERFALVLDDAHRIEDPAVREFLTDIINRAQKAKVIVTTRESPRYDSTLPGRRMIHLGGLDDQAVHAFFAAKQVPLPAELLPKVREEVGGHPLALNLLLEAAQELQVPVVQLLDRIPERNIEDYLLQEVYGSLTEDEKQVLLLSSLFRANFTAEDLNAVSKKPADHHLLRLRRRLLLQPRGNDFVLHEVIRNFFYKLLRDRESFHAKLAAHYLTKNSVEGRLEAMHHYLAAGRKDQVLHLLEEDLDLKEFDFIDAGYQNLYFAILNLFDKKEVTDARRWALICDEKGDILLHRGDPTSALKFYTEADAHFTKAKEKPRMADLAWKRGLALERLNKPEEARRSAEAGLKIAEEGQTKTRLTELLARLAPAKRAKVPAK
ncbi:MAG: NACHT domain-containing protein [Euryarchaeota archaeon]|nr:NACHT domain-containing protein [Euryarchaeota archaeon]